MSDTSRLRWVALFVVAVLCSVGLPHDLLAEPSFPTREIEPFRFIETLRTTGKLKPRRDLTMKSKISEEVVELPVSEGETVARGTLLLQFDTDLLKARLDRARHREARARHQRDLTLKDYNRKKSLLNKNLVSQAEFDRAKLEYKRAKENLNIAITDRREAEIQYRNTRVESPYSGVLERRIVELGEQVNRGEPLLEFLQIHPLELQFEVTPEERQYLNPGDTVYVDLPGMNPRQNTSDTARYTGHIKSLNENTNPNGLYTVKSLLPNGNRTVHPGRTVDVSVPLRTFESVVEIPLTYLDRTAERTRIILYDPEDDEVHRRGLDPIDYRGTSVIVPLEWPETWELVPGGIYTDPKRTDQ